MKDLINKLKGTTGHQSGHMKREAFEKAKANTMPSILGNLDKINSHLQNNPNDIKAILVLANLGSDLASMAAGQSSILLNMVSQFISSNVDSDDLDILLSVLEDIKKDRENRGKSELH